jgi:hypothetical protein
MTKEHRQKMQEHKSKHHQERVIERKVIDYSAHEIMRDNLGEYGYKDTPTSDPRPLAKPNRRAFLMRGKGVQGVIYILDAADTKVVLVTAITLPHPEWGPLANKYKKGYVKA